MRKVTVQTFVSLDGVMQAPGGPDEDRSSGFEHGGWVFPHWDDTVDAFNMQSYGAGQFDLLLGRKTYDIFASYWPTGPEPISSLFNRAHKYVASRTLEHGSWLETTVLRDAGRDVAALKAGEGPTLLVIGSGDLAQTLLSHDLVDELMLMTFPVLLGNGKKLFGAGTRPAGLSVVGEPVVSGTGVVCARYARAGKVEAGSFVE